MKRRSFLVEGAALAVAAGLAWRLSNRPDAHRRIGTALPPHHDPAGGFRNPWPTAARERGGFLRWMRERRTTERARTPRPEEIATANPQVALPAAPADEIRITWLGHATFLVQAGGLNLLTDPHLTERASPFERAGPRRFSPPGLQVADLPPIDAVLLSHDHYDHLDDGTVAALRDRFGDRTRWITPLGYREWFARRGIGTVTELDWWQETAVGRVTVTAVPAQHWTSRAAMVRNNRLWASFSVALPDGRRILFCGDSGWFPGHGEIAERAGPFAAVILPIGAYAPRWFMRPVHMTPEEAVQAYGEMGSRGLFIPSHFATFRLADEPPLEPPVRLRRAWSEAALPESSLWIPAVGETRTV
jgi:N-acyl-phosphatidylethanolamine-hydrolysing phospholipase D